MAKGIMGMIKNLFGKGNLAETVESVLGGAQSGNGGSDNILGSVVESLLGGGKESSSDATGDTGSENPLGSMVEGLLGGGKESGSQAGGGILDAVGDLIGDIAQGKKESAAASKTGKQKGSSTQKTPSARSASGVKGKAEAAKAAAKAGTAKKTGSSAKPAGSRAKTAAASAKAKAPAKKA